MFQFWHFSSIFVLLKLTCLVTLFDRKLQLFKNSLKLINLSWTFVHSKCKLNSLRSQYWMRLFLWFSNSLSIYLLYFPTLHNVHMINCILLLCIPILLSPSYQTPFRWMATFKPIKLVQIKTYLVGFEATLLSARLWPICIMLTKFH